MALTSRHRWCIERIKNTFKEENVDESIVQDFIRQPKVLTEFNTLFSGKGKNAIFVHYQRKHVSFLDNAVNQENCGQAELFLSFGDSIPMTSKCCYFIRSKEEVVDVTVENDTDLLFGEISATPLKSIETILISQFVPLFSTSSEWGKTNIDQKLDFDSELFKFTGDVSLALQNLSHGIKLRSVDNNIEQKLDSKDLESILDTGDEDSIMIQNLKIIVEEWCKDIEKYMETHIQDLDSLSKKSQSEGYMADKGPRGELEFWRHRMQLLNSIMEQQSSARCQQIVSILQRHSKNVGEKSRSLIPNVLHRWKNIDIFVTEAANETKDNIKYLSSLQRFISPIYDGNIKAMSEAIPALVNSVKMIHTVARYYNSKDTLTRIFVKITEQLIFNCDRNIRACGDDTSLWDKNGHDLLRELKGCVQLNQIYQEQYRLTKKQLSTLSAGKQFDCNEVQIFGKMDLFCRRIVKLIDLFTTLEHFKTLAKDKIEGMDSIMKKFSEIQLGFRSRNHDLLDYQNNTFDRDYVEFNVRVSDIENNIQKFVNDAFERTSSINHSISLLHKFQKVFHRDAFKADLDSKMNIIFQNYGMELEEVQQLYEKQKHDPPISRNLPPVAGNITWSRHLLKRIEEPMKEFEKHESIMSTKDAKKIVKVYNRMARTLVAFEFLWYKAWIQSIEHAKVGLQATLIIRHPDDGKLYVNFDHEILQLIKEAKSLDRIGIEIPENAKMILFQQDKFKSFYNALDSCLREYDDIVSKIIPVTAMILRPHFNDFEFVMRPGMVTLTWTSMNIDHFVDQIRDNLQKLRCLISNINDIINNRIEKNLQVVSRTLLVDLPADASFTITDFLSVQQKYISSKVIMLQNKNKEIENAVEDLIAIIRSHIFVSAHEQISDQECVKLREHYNDFVLKALLNSAKDSLAVLKRRIVPKEGSSILNISKPFFDVEVHLMPPAVSLSPSIEDIQSCVCSTARVILTGYKAVLNWDTLTSTATFFCRIAEDIELVRQAIILTGCVQGIKKSVDDYLQTFSKYEWLWKTDKDEQYEKFASQNPRLEEYENQLSYFGKVQKDIENTSAIHIIGVLSLNTRHLKLNLGKECDDWKFKYSRSLHLQAKQDLEAITEYTRITMGKLTRKVEDLDSLRFIMALLREVREKESCIDMEINPVMDMYQMLERYLPSGFMDKDEIDNKTVLRSNWRKLVAFALSRNDELSRTQIGFRKDLIDDINAFRYDISQFRADFSSNGPLVRGLAPMDAVDRLSRFKEELQIRERKYELYRGGEEMFALPFSEYPDLERMRKDIKIASQLFDLYADVIRSINEWKNLHWSTVSSNLEEMTSKMDSYFARCKQLPKRLREFDSYLKLKKEIEDFQELLPLLQELSKESIKARHWDELMRICEKDFDIIGNPEFKLDSLLHANLLAKKESILEITDGADKQLKIEQQLSEIKDIWDKKEFVLQEWKDRGINVLKATPIIMEELEESQMNLQTMLTMRHVAPFKALAQELLGSLCETSDTLELWVKVQMLWCSLESVFTGGDIAKQMPKEAKQFGKVDKAWLKVMVNAGESRKVVDCCSDDLLRNSLPTMYNELEKCQKSLEGYLEQKQNAFPRFYFVSNAKLLIILSQGSDPLAMNEYYENVFDAIQYVEHDAKDKSIIHKMHGNGGDGHEVIPFCKPVKAIGNIEDWLMTLLKSMRVTMKDLARDAAGSIVNVQHDLSNLRPLVDKSIAQFALLSIQILWTFETQSALEQCQFKKTAMKENSNRQLQVLSEMSSWCLQDLGSKVNRRKIETLVTVHVHQRDIAQELSNLVRSKKVQDANDFDWLKQARFYWRPNAGDDVNSNGATVVSITDVDFNYQYEYLGSKERLVITPLTDKCYITLAQALGMYYGGAPAGPAGTGKTETVKDLGNSLGIFVVVTNCTDQMKYSDCAKIFKGLCQGGLWGCFDEFNRITLPVLSVVAQQVLAIQNAKKQGVNVFQFPGDPQNISLQPICAFFITMNPGYAGRQELPENLKALFRGVAMMTPDFQIIKKVKMCSVGYNDFDILSAKFFALYATCKEQLSNQRHYDWGLRNILSVLRTIGETKRKNIDIPEAELVYRTIRDMNLSKLVSEDVPLFLSLLADLFPGLDTPPKGEYKREEEILFRVIRKHGLVQHDPWVLKVIQLYETTKVRHGIMLVGPSGGGKSTIFKCLKETLQELDGIQYKDARFNPKAIRAQEMYGETDPLSGEWTTGVFAAMWSKFNNRKNAYNTWIIADGPVDAIWIEDLNTVLDDNRILTLANGDRIPMTENVKMMFEVETLVNASPATVSRAGIIYVSETDLDWGPVIESWIQKREKARQPLLRNFITKWIGTCTPNDPGHCFSFISRHTKEVIKDGRVGKITSFSQLFQGLTEGPGSERLSTSDTIEYDLEKLFIYCICWSLGALLEAEDRIKFDEWLRERDSSKAMPQVEEGETVFEYYVDLSSLKWEKWKPPVWIYPQGENLNFSNLLVPTMDSTRAIYVTEHIQKQGAPVLIVGAEGTAKTSTQLMFLAKQDSSKMITKRINFSSATTPGMAQYSIETELDKRGGKTYGPPNGKRMTIFFDDISMPEVNKWGDQPTLELVRLAVEYGGFSFLDKDKRGDFKSCEDLLYIAAMQHPGGGKNDIPNRLKRNFFIFNLVLPSITSINDIYGQMLNGRFKSGEFDSATLANVSKLTDATIQLWRDMKDKMLPTPTKFHYVFNMRDLSRVFQGILLTPKTSILDGGLRHKEGRLKNFSPSNMIIGLWKHECDRVFCDKLSSEKDKIAYESFVRKVGCTVFSEEQFNIACSEPKFMVNFLRDDVYDEEDVLIEKAPKIYEDGGSLDSIRDRSYMFLKNYNEEFPSKAMNLVLFEDALKHLLRINRLIEMPRGSALLVGVGGSGKQSLTKLAAYISRSKYFQITLTKQYNLNSFMDDIRELYKSAGHKRQSTTFLFTESEIKDEVFLEILNSILSTGEVPGLFAKDEMLAMTTDLRLDFLKDRPGLDETYENLKQYFIDCVRDNLHVFLCMSPLNPKFPIRARKFPGLISGPTVDWFLGWPEDALISVSRGFIKEFEIDCSPETKDSLIVHMGMVHKMVVDVCDKYFSSMRRQVYQTPKSFLSFIDSYKKMYAAKLSALKEKESRVNLGLEKLIQGAQDVEAMKIILAKEQIKLEEATASTNKMLESLEMSKTQAKLEGEQVQGIKLKCEEDAARIGKEKSSCFQDLAKAQPFVDEANAAIDSIKPAHIGEIKKLANPSDIIKLVFDCVLILFHGPLGKVQPCSITMAKTEIAWFEPSFKPYALQMMSNPNFLNQLVDFGSQGKDLMNDETVELLSVYIDIEQFTPAVAKNASIAAEGLCTYVRAMKSYHEASKVVKPKMEALSIAETQMEAANKALVAAEQRLAACNDKLEELQSMFDSQMSKKKAIEEGALSLQKKMKQASELINGLASERARWTEDAALFSEQKTRLVGDCAVACAFVSYCGPFNQQFREYLVNDKFIKDCEERGVPVTKNLDIVSFLVDVGTIGDWNIQGLPTDPLSTQNGILVTKSTRYPLLIDPQGQALNWIKQREIHNLPSWSGQSLVELSDPKLKDKLEFCMGHGKSLIIVGVEDDLDPLLDPVLEKMIIQKGSKQFIKIGDKVMDFDPNFRLYFISRLPNPRFSPELQAKTTLIDFTVTLKGLEEQLLGRVIGKEQKALEEQLNQVLGEVNLNTKSLMQLDSSLLERLTSNSGDLLEDDELIAVLANTKSKAAEVNLKLVAADETRSSIAEKREQFRPVATRGSVLYFSIVEMSMVNIMYQTSLAQFLDIFMRSMDKAENSALASKRVGHIVGTMTYMTYRYINRGLYENDKLTFVLLVALKIHVTSQTLKPSDVTLFLRGGAALDINSVRRKPFLWVPNEVWLNIVQLSQSNNFFSNLIEDMVANENMWKRWYEDNEPESMAIPNYEQKFNDNTEVGVFLKLLLVRCLRVDRSILMAKEFLRNIKEMGRQYVEPVTDTIEMVYNDMSPDVPVIFLLSRGADPTDSIETLCRKKKMPAPVVISLGEGQEPVAVKAINAGAVNGTWVLLQNCELGLSLMNELEQLIAKLRPSMDPNFRLFMTALPSPDFPLGLLQMCIKVTTEPPSGLKAGLLRSYTPGVMIDQDKIERIDTAQWRQLVFALCFMHSIVQERRKFGPLGWNVPYEYNDGDLQSCVLFLEKHLYNGPMSWSTFQYMVSAVQYGGKITDSLDVRLFRTYSELWLTEETCTEGFSFTPESPIFKIPGDFDYIVPSFTEHIDYRKYIENFPDIDSPEIFGLHPNADLTFRVQEATSLFRNLGETQPKGSSGDDEVSRESVVLAKAAELLERIPVDYVEDEYRVKIKKLGGLSVPMNIFLFQEIQRFQAVIEKVRFTLRQLQLAINGEVVMTAELQDVFESIFYAKVPYSWENTITGDEFSWRLPTLGLWFSSFVARHEQYSSWLDKGRPKSIWLTGFMNPQGLLTSMKQEVCRLHKNQKWALDDLVYHTEVTSYDRVDQIKESPAEGIFIHGLFMEGGVVKSGVLSESEPKQLFATTPIIYCTANTRFLEEKKKKEMFGKFGPYECPVYKYSSKTDRTLIFNVNFKTPEGKNPHHWILRGVSLLCNT